MSTSNHLKSEFTDEERQRLVDYFSLLIEIDQREKARFAKLKDFPDSFSAKSKVQLKLPGQFQNVPIIVSLYQFYSSFHDELIRFPKSERYSLGASCQTELLDILKQCLQAASSNNPKQKAISLHKASASLDVLRLLLSLCKDCGCISNPTYQQLDSKLSEIGRMLGGWLKSLSSSP